MPTLLQATSAAVTEDALPQPSAALPSLLLSLTKSHDSPSWDETPDCAFFVLSCFHAEGFSKHFKCLPTQARAPLSNMSLAGFGYGAHRKRNPGYCISKKRAQWPAAVSLGGSR